MSRMIPAQVDEDTLSAAERRIFQLLKVDSHTKDWTVLHSLGLANRPSGLYGEIDFVVIIPSIGIVCLEVKGGRISCQDGIWYTTNRNGKTSQFKKSPFLQSRESMFALRRSIAREFGANSPESSVPMGCAVVFPDVASPPSSPEFDRSDVIDVENLVHPISTAILSVAKNRMHGRTGAWNFNTPLQTALKQIRNYLRPNFDRIITQSVSMRRSEEKLIALTREQYDRLDELEANPRCLFEGAAGTGKTMLALENAKRMGRLKKKVLLLCFNRLLGYWLNQQTHSIGVTSGSYHRIVRKYIVDSEYRDDFLSEERRALANGNHQELYDDIYALYGSEVFDDPDLKFDVLILDEAQDILGPRALGVLDCILHRGLTDGNWSIFGDFTRQSLYGRSEKPVEQLSDYCEYFVRAKLNLNCRNTINIANETTVLSGFANPPFRTGQVLGPPVEHWYWKSKSQVSTFLEEIVGRLIEEGVSVNDMSILSPLRIENSSLANVSSIRGIPIHEYKNEYETNLPSIGFSTIHSFKGLEDQVVIVVDIESVNGEQAESMLYVAMSRARSLLVLLIEETNKQTVATRIEKWVKSSVLAMTSAVHIRDHIVEFLHRELIGPSPGYPIQQLNGEEILRPQDPPRHRYAAGILFPSKFEVINQDDTGNDEDVSEAHPPGDALDSTEIGTTYRPDEQPVTSDSDKIADTDRDISLTNSFLPSTMGLSFLMEVSDDLRVTVATATYKQDAIDWGDTESLGSRQSESKWWWREPLTRTKVIPAERLVVNRTQSFEVPIVEEEGKTVLGLHVVTRNPPRLIDSPSLTRLLTITLVNRRKTQAKSPRNSDCYFQCRFKAESANGSACFLKYPEEPIFSENQDEQSLHLLHLHKPVFAVGHGCSADWEDAQTGDTKRQWVKTEIMPRYELKPVLPTEFKDLNLNMANMAFDQITKSLETCKSLTDKYENWIKQREIETNQRTDLSPELKEVARQHMIECRKCLQRMRDGIQTIAEDSDVATAFQITNQCMQMQQVHYRISSQQIRNWTSESGTLAIEKPFIKPDYEGGDQQWRPFQLAFILMNIRSIVDPNCDERKVVDVIWFPTGGGKTEAYLGLSAFTMLLRRIKNPDNTGTTILMRYTLRLLTTQQFQRAASLICALEIVRRSNRYTLGETRFSIGLWVGSEVTPNNEKKAVSLYRDLCLGTEKNKFVLQSCPWCGTAMGPQRLGKSRKIAVKGYRKLTNPARVRHICEDGECEFNDDEGLPIAVIDEHIYRSPPTMLIGTVDKFAMLAFTPESRRIFGIGTGHTAPELIIQDELHLISGPLGSMVGHYETVIDVLCRLNSENRTVGPKIVASTATISHAREQVKNLYGRTAYLFPQQALRSGDSFFAEEMTKKDGRLYVGVFGSALTSHVTSQVRTMSALLQAPAILRSTDTELAHIDPYWTMMGYFNTLRELGHAATLIRADIREYLNAMWDRLGLHPERIETSGHEDKRRFLNSNVELTSRVQSSEITEILQRLFSKLEPRSKSGVVDVCFATNMIQVGLDVPRLSLMTIVGQPKTSSEYIQASSRVGRELDTPGLVVTNFNPYKPRDRSHYEHFRSYHECIYKYVEPTSITAFSVPVRERALHALIVILCRFWGGEVLRTNPSIPPPEDLRTRIKETIVNRVTTVDDAELQGVVAEIDDIFDRWLRNPPSKYGGFEPPDEEVPLMFPAGAHRHPKWLSRPPYATPSSMRNVDAECSARLVYRYGEHGE